MIPIQYALIGFGLAALVGSVLTIVFRPKVNAAENFLHCVSEAQAETLSTWFAHQAEELRKPAK